MNINIYTNININKHIIKILNEKWVLFNSVGKISCHKNMRYEIQISSTPTKPIGVLA